MKKQRELFMYIAGGVIIAAFLAITLYLNLKSIETAKEFNAAFLTVTALIVGYYWGSSQGSADKTDLMSGKQP